MSMTRTITTTTQLTGDGIGASTETKFDSVDIPAGVLKPGRHATVKGRVVVDSINGSDTMRVRLRFGADDLTGVVLADSGAINVAAGDTIDVEADLTCLTDGATGTFDADGKCEFAAQLLRPKSVTITDDDNAATTGTALYVALASGGGARFASANAGTADSLFLSAAYADAWHVTYAASPSGLPTSEAVYFDEDADAGSRLLHAGAAGFQGDFYVESAGGRMLKVAYSATAATDGVAVYFDDDAADSSLALVFVSPTDTTGSETTDSTVSGFAQAGQSRTAVDGGSVHTGIARYLVVSLESSSANAAQQATLSGLSVQVDPLTI